MATRAHLCDNNSPPEPDRTGLPFINANSQFSSILDNGGFVINQNVIAAYMEQQRQEMAQFIRIQNENLRSMIMNETTSQASILMRQKDEEIERATRKKMELEFMLQKLENDKLTWQRIASDNAVTATQLQSRIEQVRAAAVVPAAVEDNESCTGGSETTAAAAAKRLTMCRNCGSDGEKRVMFLPCRHLCCCSNCDLGFQFCLICNTPRKHSIEVLLS